MVRHIISITSLIALLFLSACSPVSPVNNNGEEGQTNQSEANTEENQMLIKAFVPSNGDQLSIYPRLCFHFNEWEGCELEYHRLSSEGTSFLFLNSKEQTGVFTIIGASSVCFVDYNPSKGEFGDNVLQIISDEQEITVKNYLFNWTSGEADLKQVTTIEKDSADSKSTIKIKKTDDSIRRVFYNYLKELGSSISLLGDSVSGLPKAVCSLWSNLVIPFAKYQLYSDDLDELRKLERGEIVFQGTKFSISGFVSESYINALDALYNIINLKPFSGSDKSQQQINEEIISFAENRLSSFSSGIEHLQIIGSDTGAFPQKYNVALDITVHGNTAVFHGDCSVLDGSASFISECGFKFGTTETGLTSTIIKGSFPASHEINNLEWGEEYIACAFIKSMGVTYSCSKVFSIKTLELNPDNLRFYGKGGTKGVALVFPEGTNWDWYIAGQPDWCSIECGDMSFFVTVEPFSEKREGEILVACDTGSGETLYSSVYVKQEVNKYYDLSIECHVTVQTKTEWHWHDGTITTEEITQDGTRKVTATYNPILKRFTLSTSGSWWRIMWDADNGESVRADSSLIDFYTDTFDIYDVDVAGLVVKSINNTLQINGTIDEYWAFIGPEGNDKRTHTNINMLLVDMETESPKLTITINYSAKSTSVFEGKDVCENRETCTYGGQSQGVLVVN